MLNRFDNRAQPDWPYGISLNAVIALLGNFAEALMMLCVASIVGQLKWNRAHASRPLDDFRAIDKAMREAYGSLLLLMRRRGGILVSIGAIISILVLALGLFVQQTINIVTLDLNQALSNVSIPVASLLDAKDPYETPQTSSGSVGLDEGLQTATYTGIFSMLGTMFNVSASCSTGNCSWKPYQTLAICNMCVNLTDSIIQRKVRMTYPGGEAIPSFNYTLDANGFGLGVPRSQEGGDTLLPVVAVNATAYNRFSSSFPSDSIPAPSIAFQNNDSVIMGFITMGMSPGTIPTHTENLEYLYHNYPMAQPVAYECLLQFCLKSYESNFSGSILDERLLDTFIDNTQKAPNYTWTTTVAAAEPSQFSVSSESITGLSSYLASFITGVASFAGIVPETDNTPDWYYSQQQPQLFPILQAMNLSVDGFPRLMDNLAASMSRAMRLLPYQPFEAQGTASTTEVVVKIRWAWLAYPFALLLATLLLLVFVMVESSRLGVAVWKSSILAAMIHGINSLPADAGPLESLQDMENFARKSATQFERRDTGDRLVFT